MPKNLLPKGSSRVPSYVIWRTPGAGFFSIITSTLARLHIAKEMGLIPVIDMENHASVYQEEEPVLGTRNVWEYYFLPPAGRRVADIGTDAVITDGTWPKGYPYDLSNSSVYREMWEDFVVLNPASDAYVQKSLDKLAVSKTTLAVHYRGQEMRRAKGHRFPPTLAQIHSAVEWALENHDFNQILLFTEAEQYVDAFRRRWGGRLQVSPSFRLRHRNAYKLTPAPRPQHKYLLGLEALRDALLMAESGGLVCGHSNLSEAGIMLSRHGHQPLVRISQGRNSFRPYLAPIMWYVKASLPPRLGGFPSWKPPEKKAATGLMQ